MTMTIGQSGQIVDAEMTREQNSFHVHTLQIVIKKNCILWSKHDQNDRQNAEMANGIAWANGRVCF